MCCSDQALLFGRVRCFLDEFAVFWTSSKLILPMGFEGLGQIKYVIPNCEDIDSSAPPSAPEQGVHIPLDYRTFLQWSYSGGVSSMSQGLRVLVLINKELMPDWRAQDLVAGCEI